MILANKVQRFFIAEYYVDFRKGHEGLLSEAKRLGREIYSGDVVAFVNKRRNKLKILFGDCMGVTLIYKSFSKGSMATKCRFLANPHLNEISYAELMMLLEGNSYTIHKRVKKWLPKNLPNTQSSDIFL